MKTQIRGELHFWTFPASIHTHGGPVQVGEFDSSLCQRPRRKLQHRPLLCTPTCPSDTPLSCSQTSHVQSAQLWSLHTSPSLLPYFPPQLMTISFLWMLKQNHGEIYYSFCCLAFITNPPSLALGLLAQYLMIFPPAGLSQAWASLTYYLEQCNSFTT